MKYSVTSYSFTQLTSSGKYTEKELISLAKDMGFEGIEFAEIHPPEGTDKDVYARELRKEADSKGIKIVAYCIGADLISDTEKEIDRIKKEVDIAEILGVQVMRHDASCGYSDKYKHQRGFENALPVVVKACKEITEYAKTKGIKTCIENHGTFFQDSHRVAAVVNGVDNENFGALVDIGNFMCADEDPAVAVGNVAPYAVHVHAKDFVFKKGTEFIPSDGFFMTRGGNYLKGTAVGHGVVPVLQCMRILKNAGYDGYVTVEFEGYEPAEKGIAWGLDTLKRIEKLLND